MVMEIENSFRLTNIWRVRIHDTPSECCSGKTRNFTRGSSTTLFSFDRHMVGQTSPEISLAPSRRLSISLQSFSSHSRRLPGILLFRRDGGSKRAQNGSPRAKFDDHRGH